MLTSEFPPDLGGISYYVINLARSLTERGHNVTVISRGTWRKSHHEEIDGISVYRVPFIPSYPSPFWLQGIWVNRLFKSLEQTFDLLHIHGPLVPVIHTSLPTVFAAYGAVKTDIANMPVKSFHFLVVKVLSKQLFNAERNLLDHADVVTAVSSSCARELIKCHSIDKEITVVGNGVDSTFFAPAPLKKEPYILYTGRLETIKGLTTLVESAQYVCQKHRDLRFVLAGKGTMEKVLKTMISKLKLEPNFYFAGHITSRNKLVEYYQKAEAFVLPSYYDAMPTSLLEAMSCGTPVVATKVGGIPEIVTDGEDGLLVSPKDPEALAQALLKVLDDKELRATLAPNARQKIRSNYDWGVIVDRIEAVYEACLQGCSHGNKAKTLCHNLYQK
jgi:glycosyltransferase involved in cell wall biosynthesis